MFDDTFVSDVNEKNIVTRDAYVLFYRRRESSGFNTNEQANNILNSPIKLHQINKKHNISTLEDEFYSCEEEEESDSNESSTSSSTSYTNLDELD